MSFVIALRGPARWQPWTRNKTEKDEVAVNSLSNNSSRPDIPRFFGAMIGKLFAGVGLPFDIRDA
jgi:hypothetical protein